MRRVENRLYRPGRKGITRLYSTVCLSPYSRELADKEITIAKLYRCHDYIEKINGCETRLCLSGGWGVHIKEAEEDKRTNRMRCICYNDLKDGSRWIIELNKRGAHGIRRRKNS